MDKIVPFIKKNLILIIVSIILIGLSLLHQDSFFLVILVYGLILKLLQSDIIKGNFRKNLAIIIWTSFAIMAGLMFYVNHYMPHGPSYPTGEYVCAYGDRGPCGEEHVEDISKLDIPDWAKFVRSSAGEVFVIFLLVAGIFASTKTESKET